MARAARKSGVELGLHVARLAWIHPLTARLRGGLLAAAGVAVALALATYNAADPSLNAATGHAPLNVLGGPGATIADMGMQSLGLAAGLAALLMVMFGLSRALSPDPDANRADLRLRALIGLAGVLGLAALMSWPAPPAIWPLAKGLGGFWGHGLLAGFAGLLDFARIPAARPISALLLGVAGAFALAFALGIRRFNLTGMGEAMAHALTPRPKVEIEPRPEPAPARTARARRAARAAEIPAEALGAAPAAAPAPVTASGASVEAEGASPPLAIRAPKTPPRDSSRETRENQGVFDFVRPDGFSLPELSMLAKPKPRAAAFDEGALRQNAQLLEGVLAEFGVRGQIDQIRPGPVVTLYELVPAPGVKSARVVALSDDIARSMSVAACRVAVVPGRNAIGIELPNQKRETVYLRDLLASPEYERSTLALPMALGENIGGEPYIADLSKMPHLLIAGTTGSGKSVGVNA
ncbi:DNA translocase FtsK 4TM domain-containing protein, partial [Phenylobacterium sp.]|uniref:DNA translocase FtsK 4TM domain-containing protein n=1 Tax=Phenylobacterium sp. TaxID=1871053 RepID=UPI00271FEA2E